MLQNDEAIMAGFLNGEGEVLDAVEGWIARAASPFRRRLDAQWDDVLQAARMEVTRVLRQGKFRGESSLKTYLWQIVNHVCINELRSLAKAPGVELESLVEQLATDMDSPLKLVLQKESEGILLQVFDQMPEPCRELWTMILAGLSYKEMSLRQGISEGTLRVRVLRCRKSAATVREQLFSGPKSARGVTLAR